MEDKRFKTIRMLLTKWFVTLLGEDTSRTIFNVGFVWACDMINEKWHNLDQNDQNAFLWPILGVYGNKF